MPWNKHPVSLYSILQEELKLGNSSSLNGNFSFFTLPLSMIQMAQETLCKYGSSFIHKRKCNFLSIKLNIKDERGLLREMD